MKSHTLSSGPSHPKAWVVNSVLKRVVLLLLLIIAAKFAIYDLSTMMSGVIGTVANPQLKGTVNSLFLPSICFIEKQLELYVRCNDKNAQYFITSLCQDIYYDSENPYENIRYLEYRLFFCEKITYYFLKVAKLFFNILN